MRKYYKQMGQPAVGLPGRGLKDAVQQMAAVRQADTDCLVTSDRAGHASGPSPRLVPAELLALLPDANESVVPD